jgi:tRNA pseudouridine55 synthase
MWRGIVMTARMKRNCELELRMPPMREKCLRRVDGVLVLDKPSGLSSNAAVQIVKRLFKACKAGHAGSLDPLASGVLPICLGEATKILRFLLNADKAYRFVCRLGATTTTGDAEGEILSRRPIDKYRWAAVEAILGGFVGEIEQVPPMYSAVKHQGQRLYELARRGLQVERPSRKVTIHALQLLSLQGNRLEAQVRCSKGTYVRTLAEELGEALGCGAHIVELRRTAVDPYQASQLVTLQSIQQCAEGDPAGLEFLLLPVDTALRTWPAVHIHGPARRLLFTGQAIAIPSSSSQGWVRLYEGEDRFLGIGEVLKDGRVAPRRLVKP